MVFVSFFQLFDGFFSFSAVFFSWFSYILPHLFAVSIKSVSLAAFASLQKGMAQFAYALILVYVLSIYPKFMSLVYVHNLCL